MNAVEMKGESSLKDFLLPGEEYLIPIDPNTSFGDCGYNVGSFRELPTVAKLKIASDIIRQAIKVNYFPTPRDELNLSGDCVTAAKIYTEYASNVLKISGEFSLVSVRKNSSDPKKRRSTRHVIVLYKNSGNGFYYTIDPSAVIDYGCGKVSGPLDFDGIKLQAINGAEIYYDEICKLNKDDLEAISIINNARNLWYVQNTYSITIGKYFIAQVEDLIKSRDYMNSWLSELYYIQAMVNLANGDNSMFGQYLRKAILLNPFQPKVLQINQISKSIINVIKSGLEEYQRIAKAKTKEWIEQARRLFSEDNPQNYPKAIELIQWAFWKLQRAQLINIKAPYIIIDHKQIPFYNINPRFLFDHEIKIAWIKPSAYYLGINSYVEKGIMQNGKIIWDKLINLAIPNNYGYRPLFAMHPHGKLNIRNYFGPTLVCLVRTSSDLSIIKKQFRDMNLNNPKKVIWFDGRSINWNPYTMNHLHTSDSSAEGIIHFLAIQPEFMLINRWDYPHPNL